MTILPNLAVLVAPKTELAFLDAQSIELPRPIKAMEAWDIVMAKPLPLLGFAFKVRDAISVQFGVRRIGGFSGAKHTELKEGDCLDFFLIERISPTILTLTDRDRHLDVMTCVTIAEQVLTITTSVKTHNLYGQAYMLPVGPAHKLIVRAMLSRVRRALS
jgi:Protein of unknown function (DUF2867)